MNKRYTNSIDFLIDPINNKPKLGVCEDVKILTPPIPLLKNNKWGG
jgi:hypothetical protein